MPQIRTQPEDFVVEEIPLYPLSGEGEHTFLWIEKRLQNTDATARAIARAVGVAPRDIGYAGRKDLKAITRQHFSVPHLDPEQALALELPGAKVLRATRHGNKLRVGQLRGNSFEIRVRELAAGSLEAAQERLAELVCLGMPNRFGAQRFGRSGANAARGQEILLGQAKRLDRRQARFLLSALQSEVFNEVLSRRPLPLDELEKGDVATIHASGGSFVVEDLVAEAPRAAAFEISAAGPIFGTKLLAGAGAVAERERKVLEDLDVPPAEKWRLPRGISLRGARRPIRVSVAGATLEAINEEEAWLKAVLPAGSYVTVLLEEIFGEICEGASRADLGGTD